MDDRQLPSTADARSHVRKLVSDLDNLATPEAERQFVEAVVRSCRINPAETVFIADTTAEFSQNPVATRVLLPPTASKEQTEIARFMLEIGDELRDSDFDESTTPRLGVSSRRRLHDRLTALWNR